MSRVYIIYTQGRERELVRQLQKLGLLHIEQAPLGRKTQSLSEDRQYLEGLLLKVKGICDLLAEVAPQLLTTRALPQIPSDTDFWVPFGAEIEDVEHQVRALMTERRHLQERLEAATRLRDAIEAIASLLHTMPPQQGRELFAGIGTQDVSYTEISQTLQAQIPGRFALAYRAFSGGRLALAVSVEADYAPAVKEYLEAKGIRPLALPAHIPSTLPLPEAIAQLRRDLQEGPERLRHLEANLGAIGRERAGKLLALRQALENRLAQMDAAAQFGYTDYALVVTGWVPRDEYAHCERTLKAQFPGIIVQEDPMPAPAEAIPVALKNNRWSRPYEIFISLMGAPKYGTLDPVPFVSFFFPLFCGVIIGDIGYALVIGVLALWLRSKFSRSAMVQNAVQIALHCAIATAFFGIAFGEFFGFILPYPHLGRGKHTLEFLLLSVALGATQVLLGFVLGVINALREKHSKHAWGKVGAIAALVGLGLTVGILTGQLPEALKTPSFALLAAALVVLVMSEGLIGVLELVSYVGNIISYARLMGFGLVGLKIAELINEVGHAVDNVFLAIVVGIAAHSANLALALFESTVQTARLHYVEFFQKFVELGGRKYEPFREVSMVE